MRPLAALTAALAPPFYMLYMRLVWSTSRVDLGNFGELQKLCDAYDGVVGLLWHEEVFTVAYGYWWAGIRGHTLASLSDAGDVITRLLLRCGHTVFRGGSTTSRSRHREGVIDDLVAHMRDRHGVLYGLTVDGSQGPAYRMKTGGIVVASTCGKPIALMRTWYRHYLRLPTWDRTAIPLPFNRIAYFYRGPYFAPESPADRAALERFRNELEDDLVDLAAESYAVMGQPRPLNLVKRSSPPAIVAPLSGGPASAAEDRSGTADAFLHPEFNSQGKGEMAERYEPETKALSHRDSFGECESGSSHLRLEEYALSLVSALVREARTGGRPAFDCLFDSGFDRVYALACRIADDDPKRAQRLTSEALLIAAERLISPGPDAGGECTRGVRESQLDLAVDEAKTDDEFNAQGRGGRSTSVVAAEALRLADLVRTVGGLPFDVQLVEILLERADRMLAADGGRNCQRVLTDAEIDLLLAGEQLGSAA